MKVYISSTFRDLNLHRAAVDRTLRKMGHDIIGMEHYVAEGSRPVERCKRDVEIADAYVLLLAWRYGYVPKPDNEAKHSITEIEYRHARCNAKPILAFLLDPEVPWSPNLMDSASADPTAAQAISDLRSEVGAEYLVGMFSSPEDLAGQVAAAVASLGLTTQLSQRILDMTAVTADAMGGFGTGGPMEDTSLDMIKDMVAGVGNNRAIVIRLGEGDTWWSTRLFLLASLLRSLTQVRQMVFTGRGGRFAGMASPGALLDGLATKFPVLALARRRLLEGEETQDRLQETDRQIAVWSSVFSEPPVPPPRRTGRGTGTAQRATAQAEPVVPTPERDAQVGVREELLVAWLGERLITRCIEVQGDLTMPHVQQIIECLVPDVPLEVTRDTLTPVTSNTTDGIPLEAEPRIKVIDRDAFALELAREWVRAGLPRSPAR